MLRAPAPGTAPPSPRRLASRVLRRLSAWVEAPMQVPAGDLPRSEPGLEAALARPQEPTLLSPAYIQFQRMPHRVASRYGAIAGKHILEIGGAQACIAAEAFLADGAARVTVTGLDHISTEQESSDQRLRILKADGLDLRSQFEANSMDVVFGLSILEHIPEPDRFLEEVHRVLKPGGLAVFEGNPLWSSAQGHHLWVSGGGGSYQGKTSANYFFTPVAGLDSTNPVPDWGHLLLEPEQMAHTLAAQSLPSADIACICDWIYRANDINRLTTTELSRAYGGSPLVVLEALTQRVEVPEATLRHLRQKHGEGCDYGVSGLVYVLAKPA